MDSAVVTGANGFIGSTLVRELIKQNKNVYAIVRNESSNIASLKEIPGLQIIYCSMEQLEELYQKVPQGVDVFYHLAWTGSSGGARSDYKLQLTNTQWTVDAVDAASAIGCKRFVGVGTLAEYDVNAYAPLDNSTPNAVSCYGTAKIAAHYMSKAECNRLGLEHLWAQIPNAYGIGNYTSNFVNFASKIMVTGRPANFTAGEQFYDFVHVRDVAQGLYCIGDKGKNNCSYYIGSNKPDKLKEFIKLMRDEIDPSICLHLGVIPFHGVTQPLDTFDCAKLMSDTGYLPRISFKDGYRETINWIREQIKEEKL